MQRKHWLHKLLSILALPPDTFMAPVGHFFTHNLHPLQRPLFTVNIFNAAIKIDKPANNEHMFIIIVDNPCFVDVLLTS